MKVKYNKDRTISYTEIKQRGEMDTISSFNMAQDILTEYFESFGSDNLRIKINNNALWVVTKTKLHIEKSPMWREHIKAVAYATKVKPIRTEVEAIFKDDNENILFKVKQECCVIDMETRSLRKIDSIDYPKDMEPLDSVFEEPFLTIKSEFAEENFLYEQKVQTSDIDFSNHNNNVSYVKMIINSLPCKFYEENRIIDFEIHHISESKEGQILKLYRKENSNGFEFLIKENDREVCRAVMSYKRV